MPSPLCVGEALLVVNSPCLVLSCGSEEEKSQSKLSQKKVTFNFSVEEDSEGEDIGDIFGGKSQSSKPESKSSFEKRQEKVS